MHAGGTGHSDAKEFLAAPPNSRCTESPLLLHSRAVHNAQHYGSWYEILPVTGLAYCGVGLCVQLHRTFACFERNNRCGKSSRCKQTAQWRTERFGGPGTRVHLVVQDVAVVTMQVQLFRLMQR